MKKFIMILAFLSSSAFASSALNLQLPQSNGNYQQDRVRSKNLDCEMAIGSSTNVEFGVMGIIGEDESPASIGGAKDVGVYGRITIPIGAPRERLNCNLLYQLELDKKRLEVERLREELRQLRQRDPSQLQFE